MEPFQDVGANVLCSIDQETAASLLVITDNPPAALTEEVFDEGSQTETEQYDSLPIKGKFLTWAQVEQILGRDELAVWDSIPNGPKDNAYFLLDYKEGDKGCIRGNYADDCGAWNSKTGTSVNSYMATGFDGKHKIVYVKNGLFCSESRSRGKARFIPLSPQPLDSEIIKIHRYYVTLKASDSYRKRITSINGPGFPKITIAEYSGEFPSERPLHGNAKRTKREYIRTNPKVMKKIGEEVLNRTAEEVYSELLQDPTVSPRHFKQVKDLKYRELKRKHLERKRTQVPDDVIHLISMLTDDPNVQEVIQTKDRFPCVIIYSKDQLEDMKKSIGTGSVWGVDRRYQMGPCSLTVTVYKSLNVLSKKSRKNPLFFGPLFVHRDCDLFTYHKFFAHLRAVLGDAAVKSAIEVKIECEQEPTILKSLKMCFPSSSILLNVEYLKDSCGRYLSDESVCPIDQGIAILFHLFEEGCLLESKDKATYDEKSRDILAIGEEYPVFVEYFNILNKLLYSHVWQPSRMGVLPKIWSDLKRDVLSTFIKLAIDWKSGNLPELVDKLSEITKTQLLEFRSSLCENGQYSLVKKFKHLSIPKDDWSQMSEEEKMRRFQSFVMQKFSL